MLGRNEVVLEVRRLFESVLQHLRRSIGEVRLRGAAARELGQAANLARSFRQRSLRRKANPLQQRRDDTFLVLQQGCE